MGISVKINGYMSRSSWIRQMFEAGVRLKELYGAEHVFDFSLGNPNVEPPALFREQLCRVIAEERTGAHGYMPNAGFRGTRDAVAVYLRGAHGVDITADQVIMTCGAGGGLNVILKTLLDPDDEVLVPAPYFVEYGFYVDNAGGRMVTVGTRGDFSLDLETITAAISEKTKVILINSPNNPTGRVYDQASIDGLARIINEKSRAREEASTWCLTSRIAMSCMTGRRCRAYSRPVRTASSFPPIPRACHSPVRGSVISR